ncbi:MAG: erythromycin esterase family protein [Bacteroidia bacterium]
MRKHFIEEPVVNTEKIAGYIRKKSFEIKNSADLDPLMDAIGNSRIVLLGEASHGTHEYYTWRTRISKRLISEKGFSFIAVEGDWPDCYRLNRYIKGYPDAGSSSREILHSFNRWPTWMWANWEVVALAEWMHGHNKGLSADKRAGFYGLDVYSLWESMEAIVNYLKVKDPSTLRFAENVVKCFEPYSEDEGQSYARAAYDINSSCRNDVVTLLTELRKKLPMYNTDHEAVLSAEQNAVIAVNAERYYTAMVSHDAVSWNIRDRHMMDTLNRLLKFYGPKAKAIVWEHNTHIGDARATDMQRGGMVNIGQLVSEQHLDKGVMRVGFGSYSGTVIAGAKWGAQMQRMVVPEAMEYSWEDILHEAGANDKLILLDSPEDQDMLEERLGHRAIGVVYNPAHERYGNYVPSIIPLRYEAFIYLDKTMALHPLHIKPDGHKIPETYPWGD